MATDVVMPQMGESIFEGTITKWLKKPGDKVQRDEPLFEISTDKVDAEIPAPATGILKEIKIAAGATVQVNTIVGVIDAEGAVAAKAVPNPSAVAAPAVLAVSSPAAPPPSTNGAPGIDVVMPQMGESIFEGTITKWLKKPGDQVQRDEPLFEISTDKVDAEIPAPSTGILREIKVQAGATVQVNTVVAVIGGAGAPAAAPTAAPAVMVAAAAPSAPAATARAAIPVPAAPGERVRSSPLVRRIAREQNVDLGGIPGSGLGGRITKHDIQGFIQQHGAGAADQPARPPVTAPPPAVSAAPPQARPAAAAVPPVVVPPVVVPQVHELTGELVPMTPMRKKIAERMVESRRTSAHVHSIFKVDMTRIVKLREKTRAQWEARNGAKLTFMPFIAKALMHGVRTKPVCNASVVGDSIQYHKNVNIGIAVALDWGLIVPVVKGAENLSFVGLQRAISGLGERARSKKLAPDEVQGGTITITNPGIYGPQFGTPIIPQPQVAILGMGGIFKEPVVMTDDDGNDSIAVRHIIRLVLGYDHRIVDGADADQFMVAVRDYLQNFNEDIG
ncbi:MAG TPA: 2-oxoglutarate dehydrogenase, E2 component, dihydrolipoamide succinyltransferase [Candidatus Saccharimonadales bacterium]|jgi:pyruvate dehydrogenase E2 component (dihydrolipoamide acetyltransferase)|nr:2-oxoglutarate dehydrogenase, E2 component, dihydrolipoamide succinyltransferase [Candidatus Saccharimonadales bacterium]